MKIVIALDKFKGSLSAVQACAIVRRSLAAARPDLTLIAKPMADGGEGTARALIAARSGAWIPQTVIGPRPDRQVTAGYGWFDQDRSAIVEMAAASGLELLSAAERNPLRTTSYGTGQLLAAASQRGARRLWLAVGGSATVDGGVGAATALGWRFLDEAGHPIGLGGANLERIAQIKPPQPSRELPRIAVLCDVNNPLTGPTGAATVYGPQKGATPAMVQQLEAGLRHLARLVAAQLGKEIDTVPGAGAAGGLAAGALAFLNATLAPGIQTIIFETNLAAAMAGADWVITGEGCFDEQSWHGKVVAGVTALAAQHGAKVAVVAGRVELAPAKYQARGIQVAIAARQPGMTHAQAVAEAEPLLAAAAQELAERFFR